MRTLIYFLSLGLCSLAAYNSDAYPKLNSKDKFPFKNYYLISTRLSKKSHTSSKAKRDVDFGECINLNFSINQYKICVTRYNILNNGIVTKNTKFIICNQSDTNTYKINQLQIDFVKGYIATKPYTSAFSGYIHNDNVYGKIEVDRKIFYIDPLDNFPSLKPANIAENAIIYEIPFYNATLSTLHKTDTNHSRKPSSNRRKRNIEKNFTTGRLCSLMVIVDNSFLRIVAKSNMKASIRRVLHSLDLANALFRITDFDDDGHPDNIGFTAKYVIILESENTSMNKLPLYTELPMDGKLYLYFLSQYDLLGEVCLGVAFTAQPFMNRVLGLSYTGVVEDFIYSTPTNSTGGICERPSRKDGDGSFNNLVITYRLEHDESVPQITSDLSLAHELGHSFGSDHDKTPECLGYLMAPHTFNSTYGHNFLFSSCSRKQIDEVVKFKGSCLEINSEPFCGNGLVEENEDCDCGLSFMCIQNDQCCVARNSRELPCTVNTKAGFQCHPSEGLCCMNDCRYRNISQIGLDCENFTKKCPCKNSNKRCACGIQGSCMGDECYSTECTRIGMKECKCKSIKKNQHKCLTCCVAPNQTCLPSEDLTEEFAAKSEINLDKLGHYSIPEEKFLNKNSGRYATYCIDSKCVTVLFRKFTKGNFCLYKGQLGMCQNGFVCDTNIATWSKLPESSEMVYLNSMKIIKTSMTTIVYFLLLLLLFK